MCLQFVYSEERQKRILDKLPNVIEVYKVVIYKNKKYKAEFRPSYFSTGLNKAKGTTQNVDYGEYKRGFHSCRVISSAKERRFGREVVVRCKIKKSWITTIGSQNGVVFVTDKIIMPSPRTKTKIIVGKHVVKG